MGWAWWLSRESSSSSSSSSSSRLGAWARQRPLGLCAGGAAGAVCTGQGSHGSHYSYGLSIVTVRAAAAAAAAASTGWVPGPGSAYWGFVLAGLLGLSALAKAVIGSHYSYGLSMVTVR
uniref:Uncharacterized protein n=1 Tax=Tetradesmus obliquus TaxID=3088 RepID=A0A383V648_TETOB|eukprot:jgi/Sobl393_1/3058/SZX61078.1